MLDSFAITVVQWWNRHRPWPIRERVWTLPSHPVASEAGTRLVLWCDPDHVVDAAWTARSFLHRLDRAPAGRLALDLYVDSPDTEQIATVKDRWIALFPGAVVYSAWEAVEKLAPTMPAIHTLAAASPNVRRLAVVLHAQAGSAVILAGSDVLLLGNSQELAAALHDGLTPLHLQSTGGAEGEPQLREYARRHSLPLLADGLDLGLMYLPRACLALPDADRLISDAGLRISSGPAIDRAVLALLLGATGAQPLPTASYVVSERVRVGPDRTDTGGIVARRFAPAVRHLLYARGMPRLWELWESENVDANAGK